MKSDLILVIGACGQIGRGLTAALRLQYGKSNVIAADENSPQGGHCLGLDVLNTDQLRQVVKECGVTQIYLLAGMLSATGEQQVANTWNLDMKSLISVLEIAKDFKLDRVFWPSSIAVFGPGAPKHNCPQETLIEPTTVYGISKRAGEYWCKYYFDRYGVDVRSLRYPGLISYTALPGGGMTDYAVDIFHKALEHKSYHCFLEEDTCLPMMYISDAIRATLELMEAPKEKIKIRTSYNIAGLSFSPCDLAEAIRFHVPEFNISYQPDVRQVFANNWPASVADWNAQNDWGWKPVYNLKSMVSEMLVKLSEIKRIPFQLAMVDHEFFPNYPQAKYVFTQL